MYTVCYMGLFATEYDNRDRAIEGAEQRARNNPEQEIDVLDSDGNTIISLYYDPIDKRIVSRGQ